MSSANKQSIREEVDRIKTEFDLLVLSGKMNPEIKILFQSMLMLNNLLISIFLEKMTAKNNKNSSKPSSQTEKDESSLGATGSKSKGKEEKAQTANNTRTVETVTLVPVDYCTVCGKDLSKVKCEHIERRTKIDIIFEKVVEHFDVEVKYCKDCESTVKGDFPKELHGPLQYGNGLKAYIINLIIAQMMSLNRVQKLVQSMIGEVLSETSFLNFILRLHDSLATWEANAVEEILKSHAINADETSLRVDKKNQWIHSYSAEDITLKFLHKKRGTEAINEINIIPRYSGVMIHDCWSPYLSYEHCEHGLCGSHLVRELTHVVESNGYRFAMLMKELLLETCKTVSKRKLKKLSPKQYTNLQKRYRNIITRGESELPEIPQKPNGQRGVMAKSDAHNLWERLKEYEAAVLLFAQNPHVSFTNNRAERDLRMAKVKQKVSGCFRKELLAKAYCRISSYLQTMANKGVNPLIAIQMAFVGKAL